jgi:hypothetical protein
MRRDGRPGPLPPALRAQLVQALAELLLEDLERHPTLPTNAAQREALPVRNKLTIVTAKQMTDVRKRNAPEATEACSREQHNP